jgi:hypothetical protein
MFSPFKVVNSFQKTKHKVLNLLPLFFSNSENKKITTTIVIFFATKQGQKRAMALLSFSSSQTKRRQ